MEEALETIFGKFATIKSKLNKAKKLFISKIEEANFISTIKWFGYKALIADFIIEKLCMLEKWLKESQDPISVINGEKEKRIAKLLDSSIYNGEPEARFGDEMEMRALCVYIKILMHVQNYLTVLKDCEENASVVEEEFDRFIAENF